MQYRDNLWNPIHQLCKHSLRWEITAMNKQTIKLSVLVSVSNGLWWRKYLLRLREMHT